MADSNLTTQVPDAGTPIFDPKGYINPVWHEFFFQLLRRTGGTQGIDPGVDTGRIDVLEVKAGELQGFTYSAVPGAQNSISISLGGLSIGLGSVGAHGIQYDPLHHAIATTIDNGFMSAADKLKLDGIAPGAGVASVGATAPIVSSGGTTPVISITAATTVAAGSMSAADKSKLDGIAPGAQVNVPTNLGQGVLTATTIPLTSSTGTGTTLPSATTVLAGLMSAADKTKLNGIGTGATVVSVAGTAPIASSGGANPTISIAAATTVAAGSMSAADKTKLNSMTAGAAVASVSGTAPIVSSGGTTPAISITAATGAAAGSMSAADKAKLDTIPGSISNFMAYQTVATVVAPFTFSTVGFQAVVFDDNSEYSTGTSAFTPAFSGTYCFSAAVFGTQGISTRRQIALFVNGVLALYMNDSGVESGAIIMCGSAGPIKLVAGDSVTIGYLSGLADTTTPAQNTTFFGGWRIK